MHLLDVLLPEPTLRKQPCTAAAAAVYICHVALSQAEAVQVQQCLFAGREDGNTCWLQHW